MINGSDREMIEMAERRARERGMSVAALCKAIGRGRTTWQRWKNGTHSPRTEDLREIDRVLSS